MKRNEPKGRNSISFSSSQSSPSSRNKVRGRRTDFTPSQDDSPPRGISETLFKTLMGDPLKRAMIMQLLSSEREAIEEYQRKEQETAGGSGKKAKPMTPGRKPATPKTGGSGRKAKALTPAPKPALKGPLALMRRRALERMGLSGSSSPSELGSAWAEPTESASGTDERATPSPTVPFSKVLDGVRAFVDVRSKNLDRSAGVKALLRSMGATVKEEFTVSVTHVIFKDGIFTTYQKAKLLNKCLVSVLWLEAVRTSGVRVPEQDYPAIGSNKYDHNISILCDKLQAEYQELVKDEIERSVAQEKPSSPSGSYHSVPSSSEDIIPNSQDEEVASIISRLSRGLSIPQSTLRLKTSDSLVLSDSDVDSDCGVIDGQPVSRKERMTQTEPKKLINNNINSSDIISNTPVIDSKNIRRKLYTPQNALNSDESNMVFLTSPVKSLIDRKRNRRTLYTPQKSDNDLQNDFVAKSDTSSGDKNENCQTHISPDKNAITVVSDILLRQAITDSHKKKESLESNMSEEIGAYVTIRKRRTTKPTAAADVFKLPVEVKRKSSSRSQRSSAESTTQKSEPKLSISSGTEENMSSLRISSENNKRSIESAENMSPLVVSSESTTSKQEALDQSSDYSPPDIKKKKALTKILKEKGRTSRLRKSLSTKPSIITKIYVENNTDASMSELTEKKLPVGLRRSRRISCAQPDGEIRNVTGSTKKKQAPRKLNNIEDSTDTEIEKPQVTVRTPTKLNNVEVSTDTEIGKQQVTVGARGLRSNSATQPDPEILNVPLESSSDSSAKKKQRKLYNPNDDPNELVKKTTIKPVEKEPTQINTTIKKTNRIPLTPIVLRTNIEKQINEMLRPPKTSSDEDIDFTLATPKKKAVRKRAARAPKINTDLDEQKDLIREFVHKPTGAGRPLRSRRTQSTIDDSLPIMPNLNRRSTMDFVPPLAATPRTQRGRAKRGSIVCTRFHRPDVIIFQQIVKKLGSFDIENEVVAGTTHLVAAEPTRTINLLRAMARGVWVLKSEWLYLSLENGKWLPEEEFELIEFSPLVRQCRIERQSFGPMYSMDIFKSCGPIYVTRSTSPRCSDLQELIVLCKGTLAATGHRAAICVGEHLRYDSVVCVSELWILDSITLYKCKDMDDYILEAPKPRKSDHF